jgi:hypothetical protein
MALQRVALRGLKELSKLLLYNRKQLTSLTLSGLTSLKTLELKGCATLTKLPNLDKFRQLETVNLEETCLPEAVRKNATTKSDVQKLLKELESKNCFYTPLEEALYLLRDRLLDLAGVLSRPAASRLVPTTA